MRLGSRNGWSLAVGRNCLGGKNELELDECHPDYDAVPVSCV